MANFLAYRILNGHLEFEDLADGALKEEVKEILITEGYEYLVVE